MRRIHRLALGVLVVGALWLLMLFIWGGRGVHLPAPILRMGKQGKEREEHKPLRVQDTYLETWILCKEKQAAQMSRGRWNINNKHLDLRDQSIVHEDPHEMLGDEAHLDPETCEHHAYSSMHDRMDLHRCDDPHPLYVDEVGRVCSQHAWDRHTGCCSYNSHRRKNSCLTCDGECCKNEAFCVTCCMRRRGSLDYCSKACRTSAKSYQRRGERHLVQPKFPHCFSGPLAGEQSANPEIANGEPNDDWLVTPPATTPPKSGKDQEEEVVEYLNFNP